MNQKKFRKVMIVFAVLSVLLAIAKYVEGYGYYENYSLFNLIRVFSYNILFTIFIIIAIKKEKHVLLGVIISIACVFLFWDLKILSDWALEESPPFIISLRRLIPIAILLCTLIPIALYNFNILKWKKPPIIMLVFAIANCLYSIYLLYEGLKPIFEYQLFRYLVEYLIMCLEPLLIAVPLVIYIFNTSLYKQFIESNKEKTYTQTKVNVKSVLLSVFLCYVTFGIFYIIWIYKTTKALNNQEDHPRCSPLAEIILCGFVPFYILFWIYKHSKKTDSYCEERLENHKSIFVLCTIVGILLPIISIAIMQDNINNVCRAQANVHVEKIKTKL